MTSLAFVLLLVAGYIGIAFFRALYYHYVTSRRRDGHASSIDPSAPGMGAKNSKASAARLEITAEELRKYTGQDGYRPLAFSVRGVIYDVSAGVSFYGEGNSYGVFAGREVARALGKMSLKEEDLSDDVSDFTEKEMATLEQWEAKFQGKYPVLGRVVPSLSLTLSELEAYDGRTDGRPMYLAIRGVVFDVSSATAFYGPDGAYPFAGRECARALGKYSTEEADCRADVDGLSVSEMDALRGWESQFQMKYKVVGRVVT